MDRDTRIWKFARLLIAKHGKGAFELARSRAQQRLDDGDYRIASGWARVTDIVNRMTRKGARRLSTKASEPPSDEINPPRSR